jgi:hypothetical protein
MTEATPAPGEVWDYVHKRGRGSRLAGDPLRVTRAGRRAGDWLGVRLKPLEWEDPGMEWLITREQLADGRYARIEVADA